jgi:DNA-binding MarR family transcriptional regulator
MQSAISGEMLTRVSHLLWRCTQAIDILVASRLQGPYSVTRARILFELARRPQTAAELHRALCLDAGYLSRILSGFEHQGLLTRVPTESDARQRLLSVTPAGRQAHALLARRFQQELADVFTDLSAEDCQQVINGLLILQRELAKSAVGR